MSKLEIRQRVLDLLEIRFEQNPNDFLSLFEYKGFKLVDDYIRKRYVLFIDPKELPKRAINYMESELEKFMNWINRYLKYTDRTTSIYKMILTPGNICYDIMFDAEDVWSDVKIYKQKVSKLINSGFFPKSTLETAKLISTMTPNQMFDLLNFKFLKSTIDAIENRIPTLEKTLYHIGAYAVD